MDEDVLKAVWFALSEFIYDKINGKQPKVIFSENAVAELISKS